MICPKCGEEIDDDSNFCSYCKSPITQERENFEDGTGVLDENSSPPSPYYEIKIKIPRHVFQLVSILAGVAFYVTILLLGMLSLVGLLNIGGPNYKTADFSSPDGYCDYCGKKLSFSDMLFQSTKRGDEFCRYHRGYNKFQVKSTENCSAIIDGDFTPQSQCK